MTRSIFESFSVTKSSMFRKEALDRQYCIQTGSQLILTIRMNGQCYLFLPLILLFDMLYVYTNLYGQKSKIFVVSLCIPATDKNYQLNF